jgi:AhpD family alkylhydroperoxidase
MTKFSFVAAALAVVALSPNAFSVEGDTTDPGSPPPAETTPPPAETTPPPEVDDVQTTRSDIEESLGFVPAFLDNMPDQALIGAWQEMKGLLLNDQTAIPNKFKELIGLGVAAQIPCAYCTYFHREAAKMNESSEDEIKEAVVLSAVQMHFTTLMMDPDLGENVARDEMQRIIQHLRDTMAQPAEGTPPAEGATPPEGAEAPITDHATALADIEKTLGFVPTALQHLPQEAMIGFWKELKATLLSETLIPMKYKALIGLATSAHKHDEQGTRDHMELARIHQATDQEIHEALGVAAITGHWSTILNGMDTDMNSFRSDVDRILQNVSRNRDSESPGTGTGPGTGEGETDDSGEDSPSDTGESGPASVDDLSWIHKSAKPKMCVAS